MSTSKTFRRGSIAVGAVAVTLVASHAAIGSADPAQEPTRAEAALTATQGELADTQHRVSAIQREQVVGGREIYSLTGPNTRCILVARLDQELGHSESLACSDQETAVEQRPFRSGFASGSGYVDLVWPTGGLPSQVDTDGPITNIGRGTRLLVVSRPGDDAAQLTWTAANADRVELHLPSRAERDAQQAPR